MLLQKCALVQRGHYSWSLALTEATEMCGQESRTVASNLLFNRAAPRPPTRKNREPSPRKIGSSPRENTKILIFEFSSNFGFFELFMAVLGPRKVSMAFPEPVRSYFTPECPKPTHLDPIQPQNYIFRHIFPTCFRSCSKKHLSCKSSDQTYRLKMILWWLSLIHIWRCRRRG